MIFLEGLEGMVVLHYLVYHLQSLHYYCFNLTLGSSMASSDFVVCWAGMQSCTAYARDYLIRCHNRRADYASLLPTPATVHFANDHHLNALEPCPSIEMQQATTSGTRQQVALQISSG